MQEARLRGPPEGGPSRARTDDLRHAMAALSQLSYGPQSGLRHCSPELEIASRANPEALVVLRRAHPQVNLDEPVDRLIGNEVTTIELGAVRSQRVELTGDIWTPDEPTPRTATRVRANHNNVSLEWRPLALNAKQGRARVEDQVVSATVDRRPIYVEPQLQCGFRDRRLRDRPFLVRRQHRQRRYPSTRTDRCRQRQHVPLGRGCFDRLVRDV